MQAEADSITVEIEARRIEVQRVVFVSQNYDEDDYPPPVLGQYPLGGDHDGED